MKVRVERGNIAELPVDAIVVTHYEGGQLSPGTTALVDSTSGGLLSAVIGSGNFSGKHHETLVLFNQKPTGPRRILLAGLGKKKDFSLEILRGAFAKAAREIRKLNLKSFHLAIDGVATDSGVVSAGTITEAIVEGAGLGLYQFNLFKTVELDQIKELDEMVIVEDRDDLFDEVRKAAETAALIVRGVNHVRDLVSHPSNEMTPGDLAEEAMKLQTFNPRLKTRVYSAAEIQEMGMNALLGVAKGSDEEPKFIVIEYRGAAEDDRPVVLIGKGLTFDSGGISLKPAEKMEEMKTDMSGAAAVMGAIRVAADLELPVNVVSIVPAVENLPSGKSYKPGDILKSMSGLTIEVINTDAEGRLTLADALFYAQRYRPQAVVDLATLTGACVVALGEHAAGMMGNDAALMGKLKAAAEATAEKVWELPLWDEYQEMVKSDVADYKNSAGRGAGTITAAALLSKFVGEYPWAHLDIAGMVWLGKDKPVFVKGASGYGVRLLVRMLRDWYKSD